MKKNIRRKGLKSGSRFWGHRKEDSNDLKKIHSMSQKRKIKKHKDLRKIHITFYSSQYALIYFSRDNLIRAVRENRLNAHVKNIYIKRNDNTNKQLLPIIPKRMCRDCFLFFNNYPSRKIMFIANLTEVYAIAYFSMDITKNKSPLRRPIKIEFLQTPIKISDHLKFSGNFYIKFNPNCEYILLNSLLK